jgi:hypothetical protein
MVSTNKHLSDENVLDILNDLDECLISESSDSSDDSDDSEDDIAVADVVPDSDMEEGGQGHSLGDTDYNSGFIWEDMDNYRNVNYFLVNLDLNTVR